MARRTAKKIVPLSPVRSQWTAGDRVACLTAVRLRDHRVNALIKSSVDVDLFIQVTEALEGVLDATCEAESTEGDIPVEELPDAIRAIEKARIAAVEESADKEKAADDRYDDLVREGDLAADKHAEELKENFRSIDDLRARAEKAEEDLAKSVRNGHTIDADGAVVLEQLRAELAAEKSLNLTARDAVAQYRDQFAVAVMKTAALETENGQLKQMIALLRAKKPVKARKAKS